MLLVLFLNCEEKTLHKYEILKWQVFCYKYFEHVIGGMDFISKFPAQVEDKTIRAGGCVKKGRNPS
jgi:hypothetical protein